MQIVDSVAASSAASSDGGPEHETRRRVEELGAGLYLVHDPLVIVCEKCQILVSNPVGHLESKNHKVRNSEVIRLIESKISGIEQESHWMCSSSPVVDALPFIPVLDGWKCTSCKKCTQHAQNLDCCEVWTRTRDVQKVKIQRFGEGAYKRAVEVKEVLHFSSIKTDEENSIAEIVEQFYKPTPVIADSMKEMNGFYQALRWFTDGGAELQEILELNLHDMFARPVGVSVEWEQKLRQHFVAALNWANELPKPFLDFVRYRHLKLDSTLFRYASAFVWIVYFVLNLRNKPIEGEGKMRVAYPFDRDFWHLVQKDPDDSVFDLFECLMSQSLDSRSATLFEVILRIYCVDEKKRDLKDPTYIQTKTAPLFKLCHLTALVQSHRKSMNSTEESMFKKHMPSDEVSVLSVDAEGVSSFREADWDDEIWETDEDGLFGLSQDDDKLWEPAGDDVFAATVKPLKSALREELVFMKKLVTKGCLFAIETIIDVKNLSRTYGTPREPRITKLSDRQVSYNSTVLDINNLSQCVVDSAKIFEGLLEQLSIGIDTTANFEDLHQESMTRNCIEHKDKKATSRMLVAVLKDPELKKKFVDMREGESLYFSDAGRDWLKKLDEAEQLLPLLIHLTGGMPGRSTELETYRFRGSGATQRHVFFFDENLYIAPSYRKTQCMQADDIGQFRFLPKWLSLLLIRYFVFIRPFAHALAISLIPDYRGDFMDRVFTKNGFAMNSRSIRTCIAAQLVNSRFPVTFGELRHIIKFLFNEGLVTVARNGGLRSEHLVMFALNIFACIQFNHSPETGRAWYGTIKGQPKNNKIEFTAQRSVSKIWHDILDISRSPADHLDFSRIPANAFNDFLQKLMASVSDLAAFCASSLSAGHIDDRKFHELKSVVLPLLLGSTTSGPFVAQQMSKVLPAEETTAFLSPVVNGTFPAAAPEQMSKKRRRFEDGYRPEQILTSGSGVSPMPILNKFSRFRLQPLLEEPSCAEVVESMQTRSEESQAAELLRKLYGPTAEWKSPEQKLATFRCLFSEQSFLCVLGTNGGKSALFMAKALQAPHMATVVLVPTLSLVDDILRRTKARNVDSSSELTMDSRGIVVMTYNKLQTKSSSAAELLLSLIQEKRVSRIFFDEAHCQMTDNFRDPQRFLPALASMVPITLLTATAPTEIAIALTEHFLIAPSTEIRAGTNRSNLVFQVEKYTEKPVVECRIIEEIRAALVEVADRVIVYCASKRMVESVRDLLEAHGLESFAYTSDVQREERKVRADLWMLNGRVMVATSAFGPGVDYPHVRLVVFWGLPFSLVDYVQMSGRAGRDGKRSKSLLFFNKDAACKQMTCVAESQKKKLEFMLEFAESKFCRRELVTFRFDGHGVQCSGEVDYSCDNCLSLKSTGQLLDAAKGFGDSALRRFSGTDLMPSFDSDCLKADSVPRHSELGSPNVIQTCTTTASDGRQRSVDDLEDSQPNWGSLEIQMDIDSNMRSVEAQKLERQALLANQKAEVQLLRCFFEVNSPCCLKCLAEKRDAKHFVRDCKFAQQARCDFCLDISAFKHSCFSGGKCPFKLFPKNCCAGCWFPNSIGDFIFHKVVSFAGARYCPHFSIKLYYIRARSLQLSRDISVKDGATRIEREYRSFVAVQGEVPFGVSWFVHSVLKSLTPKMDLAEMSDFQLV